ncbi:hypothetical protein FGK63_01050 [Ruegeria sediminis]|uniref:Uncharacterized protein n=1 Tax=Ruegeria sediminis TaxID=2583820 RepID=A0ABY2X3M3_9RHOB|nr:hypothetical protein [Ruegeria sediminis]TMV09688.1 hypothetical protein FGK63_01050 [Ruegeria sediminis]
MTELRNSLASNHKTKRVPSHIFRPLPGMVLWGSSIRTEKTRTQDWRTVPRHIYLSAKPGTRHPMIRVNALKNKSAEVNFRGAVLGGRLWPLRSTPNARSSAAL